MSHKKLIWIDLEMSGLDYNKDVILEIATIITDQTLQIIEEGPNIIIHHSDEILDNMDAWCIDHHGKTGLTQAVKDSKISMQEAEQLTLDFLKKHCDPISTPLCGNSVWFDKLYLNKDMPQLAQFFHYRVLDVTSVRTALNLQRKTPITFPKNKTHRALDDIRESIGELTYCQQFFAPEE